jgi:hypothetical protein
MHISLYSATKQEIGSFTSPAIPRSGELISLDSCLFQVTNVCYQIVNENSNHAIIEVAPINDAARQHIGEALLKAS